MKRSAAARAALAVAVLLPLVVLAAAVGLSTGAGALSLRDALRGHEPDATVLFRLRMPRVLLAAEVGAALSVAGVALQALLRNPLADPFRFGLSGGALIRTAVVTVASGSAIGAAAASAASFAGVLPTQLAAVAGALAAARFAFTLGRARGQLEPARALLVGVVFNSFASALVLSVEAILAPDQMQAVSLWLAGTLGYEAMPLLAGAGVALLLPALGLLAPAGGPNLLAPGGGGGGAPGGGGRAARPPASFAPRAPRGAAVAFTGLVGFVGLIVPHAVRLLTGPDHRVVLPASALGGAAFLVLADALARVLFRGLGAEPPVGAVTAIVGAPLFVLLMRSRQ